MITDGDETAFRNRVASIDHIKAAFRASLERGYIT